MRLLLPILLMGCAAHVPRFPGPLGPIAHERPAAHVSALPRVEAPVDAARTGPARPEGRSEPVPPDPPARKRDGGFGEAIARAADHHLKHAPRGFRNDCSGFVMAAYDRAGEPISGNTRSLYELAKQEGRLHKRKRPDVGDLVFFDDTYDRNGNGRRDDPLSHVGIVIAVDDDDTITVAHGGTSKGRTTMHMNLRHPDDRTTENGAVLNDHLRARLRADPANAPTLSGQLFRAFARPR